MENIENEEGPSSGSDYVSDSEIELSEDDEDVEDDLEGLGDGGFVENQIEGEFDRLIGNIQSTVDVANASMLSKIWDAPLQDNSDEQFHDDLRAASGIGKAGRRRGGARSGRQGPVLSHQVRALIGEGNTAYVDGNPQEAIRVMTEVIRIEPRAVSAWSVLSTCYRDLGEPMKALQLAIMGAHLRHDADEWYELARQSRDLGYSQQALYCLAKATKLDPNNFEAIWERASLAKDVGDNQAARNSYLTMLRRFPHNIVVLTELRYILIELGDLRLCAKLYQEAFDHYTSAYPSGKISEPSTTAIDPSLTASGSSSGDPQAPYGNFAFMEVLVLADLYNGLGWYERAVKAIRAGCRWLQGRSRQKFWDSCPDDREYDMEGHVRDDVDGERAGTVGYQQGFYPLDINARHRLAIARLKYGYIDEGRMHAEVILAQSIADFSPLFAEIADAYFDRSMWVEARPIYEMLGADAGTSSIHVLMQAAACRRNLGDTRDASEVYVHIISSDPTNNDAKMKLAEIYEIIGQPRKALELVYQVIDSRKRRLAAQQEDDPQEVGVEALATPFFTERRKGKVKQPATTRSRNVLSREAVEALERQKEAEAQLWYSRVKQLWDSMLRGEEEAVSEWLFQAERMVEMFRETRNLFPARGAQPFRGMIRPARSNEKSREAEEEKMASRLELELDHENQTRKAKSDPRIEVFHFRGIQFDDWLLVIIQYAFLLTQRGQYDNAEEILRHILLSNVYQRQATQDTIRLALTTCALRQRNFAVVLEMCRKVMVTHQFNNEPFRLFLATLASGLHQTDQFINSSFQKFVLRELRIGNAAVKGNVNWNGSQRRFAVVSSEKVTDEPDDPVNEEDVASASAKEKSDIPEKPTKDNPVVVAIHGQSSMAAKSYQSAIFYLLQAYGYHPNDPVICLCLAVASLGRAMQRQADNRNYLVTQSLGFLTQYRTLRRAESTKSYEDEIEFNFGRAFHQIGLLSHAVKHYERALEIVDERQKKDENDIGVSREAAYNLSLIYVMTGASPLAQTLYRRWLSI